MDFSISDANAPAKAGSTPVKAPAGGPNDGKAPAYKPDTVDPRRLAEAADAAKARPANLNDAQLANVAVKKATCPFIGSAVQGHALPVRNGADKPLAAIDDVVALGNTGGGDLGEVLRIFATGNHARMVGPDGKLDAPVPSGLFSLDFPGSQGSHPGHSGILQGDPTQLDSGRFSAADFDRLARRAKNGYLKRSDIAAFIAENLHKDPHSKVNGLKVAELLAGDAGGVATRTGPALLEKVKHLFHHETATDKERALYVALTRNLGEDNLVGSAGEFGLLMAFLAHSPNSKQIDGEPAVRLADVQAMFRDHQFPEGWETWKKTKEDWVVNTTALLVDAAKDYHTRKG